MFICLLCNFHHQSQGYRYSYKILRDDRTTNSNEEYIYYLFMVFERKRGFYLFILAKPKIPDTIFTHDKESGIKYQVS